MKHTYDGYAILRHGGFVMHDDIDLPLLSRAKSLTTTRLKVAGDRVVKVRVTIETIDTPTPTTPEEGARDEM